MREAQTREGAGQEAEFRWMSECERDFFPFKGKEPKRIAIGTHASETPLLFLVITSKRGPPSAAGADTHATQPQVVLECSSVQALVFAGVPRGRGRFSRVVGQKALRGYFV